ncbi:hypothetical protein CCR85_09695 [Rhodothalassium salexigens]|uniref:alkaline phosphatase n=1 Tax=Rhodothalassium salexigens TaxID=1086 RepID=UPI0019125A4E|nr:alkaline phosphatase [Rhodothalassium salexigens]MBK5911758.1 hypothetical protein [Rhodothalassium salexigens]
MHDRRTLLIALAGLLGILLLVYLIPSNEPSPVKGAYQVSGDPWFTGGKAAIERREAQQPITKRAKNVIVFIGDGMGVSTVTAGRIYAGQKKGLQGEDYDLAFDTLPYTALVKTYNTNAQTPDSAGTASAIMTGVKTKIGVLSLSDEATPGQCPGPEQLQQLSPATLLELAESVGMATGIVTTTRLTHATPASTYAHSPSRNWEDDSVMPPEALEAGCTDIASQFVDFPYGDGVDVAFGGGRRHFLPEDQVDPESDGAYGRRVDGRDLIEDWRRRHGPGARFVWNTEQFRSLSPESDGPVLGLFEPSHMQYEADRADDRAGEPPLSEMVDKALGFLEGHDDGYFLLVEGGRIDHAHHAGNAARALEETREFSKAVQVALDRTNVKDTLVLVTADHSHTFVMGGYPPRGNPILGLVHKMNPDGTPSDELQAAEDGKPYTTLGYLNGPGAHEGERPDLTDETVLAVDYRQQSAVPTRSETHGGEDVALYARGPWAHLATGTMEQNVLFHIVDRATGLGDRAGRD